MSASTPPQPVVPESAERRSGFDRRMALLPSPTAGIGAGAVAAGPRIQAAPVLTGFIVAAATWFLLDLALIATGVGHAQVPVVTAVDPAAWWWSGAMGALALLLGGLTAGATAQRRTLDDGILHGIGVWAITIVGAVLFTTLNVGLGFGVLADTITSLRLEGLAISDAVETAAAGSVLLLGATFLTAVIGAMVGAWLWRTEDSGDAYRV